MADITSKLQGNVSDEGQVNWRGDQVTVVQGGQSIYETSSVQLAELGSRKVVGDRVFRYALSGGTITAGLLAASPNVDAKHLNTTIATNAVTGVKALTIVLTTSAAANYFAEGYVHVQSGTAANIGHMYKIKSHGSIGDTSSGVFSLYDSVKVAIASNGDKVTLFPSQYSKVVTLTDQTGPTVGIAPIAVSSSDYFWLQTWGPCAYIAGSAGVPVAGGQLVVGSAGMAETSAGAACFTVGYSVQQGTALEACRGYLMVAP
jgi:hypothetical protein